MAGCTSSSAPASAAATWHPHDSCKARGVASNGSLKNRTAAEEHPKQNKQKNGFHVKINCYILFDFICVCFLFWELFVKKKKTAGWIPEKKKKEKVVKNNARAFQHLKFLSILLVGLTQKSCKTSSIPKITIPRYDQSHPRSGTANSTGDFCFSTAGLKGFSLRRRPHTYTAADNHFWAQSVQKS